MRIILCIFFMSLSLTCMGQSNNHQTSKTTNKEVTSSAKFKDLCSTSGVLITTKSYNIGECELPYSIGSKESGSKGVEKFSFTVCRVSAGNTTAFFLDIAHRDHLYGLNGSSCYIEYNNLKQLKDAIYAMQGEIGKPFESDYGVYSYITPDELSLRLLNADKADAAYWEIKLELFTKDIIYNITDITPFLNKIEEGISKIDEIKVVK